MTLLSSFDMKFSTITADSRKAQPGALFLAYPGVHNDGRNYIAQAIQAGAAAVAWESRDFTWNPDWRVANAGVSGLKEQVGELAAERLAKHVPRRVHGGGGLDDQVVELERLDQVGIPDQAAILDRDVRDAGVDFCDPLDAGLQRLAGAEHGAVFLHRLLHLRAELRGGRAARCVAELVEAGEVIFAGAFRQVFLVGVGFEFLAATDARCAAEDDEVDQRVGAEAVGAVDRHAGRFADSHQARHDRIRIIASLGEDFAVIVRGDAAHVVVHGRQHRDRLFR